MLNFFRYPNWPRIAPFATLLAFYALRGAWPSLSGSASSWDARWLAPLGALCAALLLAAHWRHYAELSCQNSPTWREATYAAGAGVGVFALWIMLDEPWMRIGLPVFVFRPVNAHGELMWSLLLTYWLATMTLLPLAQELFWRSFLMRRLQAPAFEAVAVQDVGVRAVVISSMLCMLTHPLWLAGLFCAVVSAWLYIRSGKLWLPVIAHGVTNGLFGAWVVLNGTWAYWSRT